jgi:hypothetical protein
MKPLFFSDFLFRISNLITGGSIAALTTREGDPKDNAPITFRERTSRPPAAATRNQGTHGSPAITYLFEQKCTLRNVPNPFPGGVDLVVIEHPDLTRHQHTGPDPSKRISYISNFLNQENP